MHKFSFLVLAVVLAGCDRQQAGQQNTADALDAAARQSDPEAAGVLRNAADAAREMNVSGNLSDPDSFAQNSLQNAGNAQ